jgi:large subunit ribosomal protein L15
MGKTKTKKFRGSGRHGRGRKGGRGKGLRGGSGNAGLHKHKYASTVIREAQGIQMFGHRGFKRPQSTLFADATINVGELPERFRGQTAIDLGAHGFTKLLGAGEVAAAFQVTVEAASAGAVEKIQAAGGKVTTSRAPWAGRKTKAAPAKGGAPAATKPAPKPAGGAAKAPPAKPTAGGKPAKGA